MSRIDSSFKVKSQPIAFGSQRSYYCGAHIKEDLQRACEVWEKHEVLACELEGKKSLKNLHTDGSTKRQRRLNTLSRAV
jgi:hypothetical protein